MDLFYQIEAKCPSYELDSTQKLKIYQPLQGKAGPTESLRRLSALYLKNFGNRKKRVRINVERCRTEKSIQRAVDSANTLSSDALVSRNDIEQYLSRNLSHAQYQHRT